MGSLDAADLADSALASDLDDPFASSRDFGNTRNGRGVNRWRGLVSDCRIYWHNLTTSCPGVCGIYLKRYKATSAWRMIMGTDKYRREQMKSRRARKDAKWYAGTQTGLTGQAQ